MKSLLLVFFCLAMLPLNAQRQGGHHRTPVLTEISNKEIVQSVYADATKVEKLNDYWYSIVDDSGKVYGYAMTSTDYCSQISGYNGPTPVMIITDNRYVIQKVALMSHCETPGYINRMEIRGFFDSWNGKTLQQASRLQVDAVSGATLTAVSVIKNVEYLVRAGQKYYRQ